MDTFSISDLLETRAKITSDTDPALGKCQKALTNLCCGDMPSTLAFLRNACTAQQFVLLSELFDSIAEKSQNRDFIAALRFLAEKYPEATREHDLLPFIDFAEDCIYY